MADVTLNIRHNADQATGSVISLSNAMGRMAANSRSASTAGNAAANGFNKIGLACLNAGRSASHGATGISKFVSSLGRIAYYRAIRTAIKYVGKAFTDGLQAAYAFSKANQPADYAKLAGAMDGIKKAASTMSLQLGAAFGGLITAIAPVLIKIINLVTQAADAITRFFAALSGSGYYKHAAEGFDDVGDSAGGAGKKVKGLLASWDELNVIGKESGGGGGGSNTPDYSGAYEWVEPFSDWADLLQNGNFFGIGESINNALGNVLTVFDGWLQKVRELHLGQKLADIIAGFFAPDENGEYTTFKKAGETLADALIVILEFIEDFLRDPPWDDIAGAFGAFWDSFWGKLKDSMDTTTITGGADGGFGEEGFQPYWDVIWNKLFPDGWFTGDNPSTGNSLVTVIDEKIFRPIFEAIDNGLNMIDQYITTYWRLFTAKADELEAKTKLAVLNWIAELTADITNGLAAMILKVKIWWQDVVVWINEVDLSWNEWLVGFYTAMEKIKTPLQMVLNDLKQIVLEKWGQFLRTLYDDTTTREVLEYFGIDLPGAIRNNNKALGEAQAEARELNEKYEALKNGTYDVTEEHTDLKDKIDSAKKAIEDAKTKSAAYKDELANMKNVTAEDAAQTGWLKTAIENNTAALNSAKDKVSVYEGELATLKGGLGETKTATEVATQKTEEFADVLNEVDGTRKSKVEAEVKDEAVQAYKKGLETPWGAKIGVALQSGTETVLNTVKDAFNAVKDKTGKLTITQDKKNPKPKDLDKMATAYGKFKDNSTKNGAVNLTSKGDLLSKVGNALFLTVITTAWNSLSAGTKKLTVQLDSGKTDIASFVAGWNKLSDKTVRFSISVDEEMKSKWNYLGKKWNNSPLASAYGRLPLFAKGGFPEKGQLFIANEAGPELVSTMGGQTAVANNDQIIAGIQRGTEQANEEQNELLRGIYAGVMKMMQNGLTVSPSVGLGQVVARSNALYGRA